MSSYTCKELILTNKLALESDDSCWEGVVSRDILKDGSAETHCWVRPRWEVK